MIRALLLPWTLVLAVSCDSANEAPAAPVATGLQAQFEGIERGTLPSFSVVVLAGGDRQRFQIGQAPEDPIYLLASVSKPVVGLAIAHAVRAGLVTLDGDVNTWLDWPEPLEHPDYPGEKITLRMLARHESGLGANAPFDFETYPKPDPDQALDPFLRRWAGPDGEWADTAPGERFAYSNLGAALAALVIERATGLPFEDYCQTYLFDPLGLDDTAWTLAAYSDAQRARVATPYDADGQALAQYAFNDYPSGLLRSTAADFGALMAALMAGGAPILDAEGVALFEQTPLFIEPSDWDGVAGFTHDGGEAGVIASFAYREDGTGWFYVANGEWDTDEALDRFQRQVEQVIASALE